MPTFFSVPDVCMVSLNISTELHVADICWMTGLVVETQFLFGPYIQQVFTKHLTMGQVLWDMGRMWVQSRAFFFFLMYLTLFFI